jgi:hypothetical protein
VPGPPVVVRAPMIVLAFHLLVLLLTSLGRNPSSMLDNHLLLACLYPCCHSWIPAYSPVLPPPLGLPAV